MNRCKNIGEMSSCPSGVSTPIFSLSPIPARKQLAFTTKDKPRVKQKGIDLYPNCDVSVWLRSCEQEVLDPIKGKIIGQLPNWLRGSLIRNGPGSLKAGKDSFQHLFDSSALLHRFIQSDTFKRNWTANRIVMTEFGTKAVPDPCHSIFQRVSNFFTSETSDNSMISVYPFGDELYAFNESTMIHRIDPVSLDTVEKVNVGDYVQIVNHTSHPHVTKEGVYNLGMSFGCLGPFHSIVKFENTEGKKMIEKAEIVAAIPARWPLHPSYMHTFGITNNFFVIVQQPLSLSIANLLLNKLTNDPLAGCFRWYHHEMTKIELVRKDTGVVQSFYSEAFFYLHIINQYEIEDHLVLDICAYRDPSMLDCMYIETMKNMQQNPDYAKMFRSKPIRFVLPLKPNPKCNSNLITLQDTKAKAFWKKGKIFVVPEKLCDLGCETPRINYEVYLGQKYRYFYAISSDVDASNPGTIIKVDTETKQCKTWCEENCYPSEPVFVAKPDGIKEDDGVVLSALVWGREEKNRAGLLVLDASTFKEICRAEFVTPGPVPKCLHGWFLPYQM